MAVPSCLLWLALKSQGLGGWGRRTTLLHPQEPPDWADATSVQHVAFLNAVESGRAAK